MTFHEKIMALALEEAKLGDYRVFPNPMVGCVLVKNGKVIAKGHHGFFGGPHAEVEAFKKAAKEGVGADMYVTMEPCSTYGKTPPCTELIIKKKVKNIFIGDLDPNMAHNGKGIAVLKSAGIKVKTGILKKECAALNAAFHKNMKTSLPYVILKFAQSLNGMIADNKNNSRWISCEKSRIKSHILRRDCDCIVAGVSTIINDNPSLDIRLVESQNKPYVCVIDPSLKTPADAKIFSSRNKGVFIITDKENENSSKYGGKACILGIKKKNFFFPVREILQRLYEKGVRRVLVEGGGYTIGQFMIQNEFDKIFSFIAPMAIGQENSINSIVWPACFSPKGLGVNLKLISLSKIGEDVLLEYERDRDV